MKRTVLALAITAASVFTLAGCDLTGLNDDPNNPTETTTQKLLTNAEVDLADMYWDSYPGSFWMRYAQYLTTNQYTDADRYQFPQRRAGSNNGNWATSYYLLNDLEQVKRINRDPDQKEAAASAFGPNANQIAIANILQAWTFHMMTQKWGPIPFEDALQGQESGNFSPPYTGQPTIYPALVDTLTQASQNIQTGSTTLGGGDLIFSGDMMKWKKFANALKMRIAIQMAERMPGAAETAINEAVQAGAFQSNADGATIPFNSGPPYQNPLYENYEVSGRDDWAAPRPLVSLMNEQDDPRRPAYFTDADPSASGGQYNGFPYGLNQGPAQTLFTNPDSSFSRPADNALVRGDASAPCLLMLHDEVLFIKAEAKLRSDLNVPAITKSGQELYRDAVAASARYWGASESEAQALADRVPAVSSSNFRQVLGTQKWVAQYLQGVEGWSTWRRLNFDNVLQIPPGDPGQAAFGKSIPVRMSYPRDEATLNESQLQSAVSDMLGGDGVSYPDGDNQGVRLWWDTTPQ